MPWRTPKLPDFEFKSLVSVLEQCHHSNVCPRFKIWRYDHLYGTCGKQRLCCVTFNIWERPAMERMWPQDNYSHNNAALMITQCQDSLEEKGERWFLLTLDRGESRLSSRDSWILIGWGNSAVVSHDRILGEKRNVGKTSKKHTK